jgi:SAM-dependent methyltransferase
MPYLQKVHGLEVWGVDYSAEGIARARRLLELHGAKAEAHLADAFALGPEWTARFAGVFSQGLVEHFADPGDVLERFAGLVRPGGLLITWVPHTAGWVVRLSTAISPALRSVYAPLDLPRLVAWQQAAGLTMVEARYTQFLDLTLVNLVGFPRLVRRGFALSGRLLSLPLVWLCNVAGWSPQDRRLCSGMITVARKPGA